MSLLGVLSEGIFKILDQLVDDFRYCLGDLIDLAVSSEIDREKLLQYCGIWDKYFECD